MAGWTNKPEEEFVTTELSNMQTMLDSDKEEQGRSLFVDFWV
jgi:hypothetical protein